MSKKTKLKGTAAQIPNKFTGWPRKWKCYTSSADDLLEVAEVFSYYYNWVRMKRTGGEMPLDVLRGVTAELKRFVGYAERQLAKREGPPLTQAELSYCEAEAIPPEEFRKLKNAVR